MPKSERLLNLLTYLRSRRTPVTAQTLSEHLGVSERTIYRDIQALTLTGVNIIGEAGIGYLVRDDVTLPPLSFTEAELESLVLGIRLLNAYADDELNRQAEDALNKIRAVLPAELMHRLNHRSTKFLVPKFGREHRIKFSEVVRKALADQKTLNIDYRDVDDRPSTREVEPLGLIFWGAHWTLAAWCKLRQDYRAFRLDRLIRVDITEHAADPEQHSLKDFINRQGDGINVGFWS